MTYGFIIDNRKCIGCHACTVACKAEHDVPLGVNRTWVKYIEKGEFPNTRRLFSVMRCNHCDDAPCVDICPVTALYTRPDGIVDFDNRRCIGCKSCMQACPYDALYIDPETSTAAKCNYCAHRVDIGLEPACVNVCPEHAIISGNIDNPASEIAQLLAREQVQVRKIEKGTRPKLFYIDGDLASLQPAAAPSHGGFVQTAQASGVGHYARFAEQRLREQREGSTGESPADHGVTVPESTGDGKMLDKAWQVVRENARRVYDAPSKGVLWGWEVSAYVWTKAIAAGAFLVPVLAAAFGATVHGAGWWSGWALALLFLLATGALLVKDLDQPRRFAYVLLRPQWKSWLVRGGYAITAYGGILTLWALARLAGWSGVEEVMRWAGGALAVLVAVYTAFLFAQAKGRDFWQTPALPLHMLVHSLLAGAAALSLAGIVFSSEPAWDHFLRLLLIAGLAANLLVLAAELLITHPTTDAKLALRLITRGRFSLLFYAGALGIGNLIPLALLLAAPGNTVAAALLVLYGIYVTEHIWVRAPQLVPLS